MDIPKGTRNTVGFLIDCADCHGRPHDGNIRTLCKTHYMESKNAPHYGRNAARRSAICPTK